MTSIGVRYKEAYKPEAIEGEESYNIANKYGQQIETGAKGRRNILLPYVVIDAGPFNSCHCNVCCRRGSSSYRLTNDQALISECT